MSITLKYGDRFKSKRGMLSLSQESVDPKGCGCAGELMMATHDSGWTISGVLHEDYFTWVTDFKATHPRYGKIVGNFMSKLKVPSEEAFRHFMKHHEPNDWNPEDI